MQTFVIKNKGYMKIIITTVGVLFTTLILVSANRFLPHIELTVTQNSFLNGLIKYQLLGLMLAVVLLLVTLKVTPESKLLLKMGNTQTVAVKEKWLGINGKSSWKTNGIQLAFFISLATGLFMFLAVRFTGNLTNFSWTFIPIVLVLSLTNSFTEEIIYRFVINGNLTGVASKTTILVVSAVLFGLPHYFGFPNGIVGVIMSGVLGYILSKVTYETQGMGISWIIHFLQDVIIFTALCMMNSKQSSF